MHFKQDFKRFVRKHLNTTLQKGILILNYVKSLSQLALNISKSFLRVGRKTPNEYPMPSWKAQISTAQMSHLCTSIMDIKKEAATMLQARAPPSGFPSPGDGKWSHKRLNVIVVDIINTYHDYHFVSLCLVRIGISSHFSDSGGHSELWSNELFRCRAWEMDGYLQVETLNIFCQLDLMSFRYQLSKTRSHKN